MARTMLARRIILCPGARVNHEYSANRPGLIYYIHPSGLPLISMLHLVVIAIFVALLLSVIFWWLVYRQFDPHDMNSHSLYRLHQVLIAVIAMLAISLAVIVVLSSDPGDPDYYLFWP